MEKLGAFLERSRTSGTNVCLGSGPVDGQHTLRALHLHLMLPRHRCGSSFLALLPFLPPWQALEKMIMDMKDPEFQHILDQTLKQLSVADGLANDGIVPPKKEGDNKFGFTVAHPTPQETRKIGASSANVAAAAASSLFSTLATGTGPEATDSLAKTLEILQRLSEEDASGRAGEAKAGTKPGAPHGQSAASVEQLSDETIARMMEEFEGMGAKEDFNFAVEGMMKQLLAKDIMYLPMKQICQKVRGGDSEE